MKNLFKNPKNLFIILLVVINAFTLAVLFKSQRETRPTSGQKKERNRDQFIINKIGLDEQQAAKFKALKKEHFEEVKHLKKEQGEMRKALLSNVSTTNFNIDSLTSLIAVNQIKAHKSAYKHFRDLRMICTPDQLDNFDLVMKKMMNRMHNDRSPKRMEDEKKGDKSP